MGANRAAGTLALIAIVLARPAGAGGAINTFTNRAAWQTAAGPISAVENFSGFAIDTPFRTAPVACNGFTLQQEGDPGNTFRNEIDALPVFFGDNNGTANESCLTEFPE